MGQAGRLVRAIFLAALTLLFWATVAQSANPFEKLLMPGPVAAPHAKIEQQCDSCHKPFDKAAQDGLCLSCHTPVAADIAARQGFHGLSPLLKGLTCSNCHDDHKGRSFDMTGLERASFPHHQTDFPLDGAHVLTACGDCHAPGKRFAEAPSACISCHKADDRHRGNLGADCKSCHSISAWQEVKPFDHRRTAFPLTGKHEGVTCAACHIDEQYKAIGTACSSCHTIDDRHQGRFGADCASCHGVTGWTPAKFDHGKDTPFPLKGAHAEAACFSCHGRDVLKPLATACFDCHKVQDVHKAQLGPDCAACHVETAWRDKVRFDHDLTRFPLTGLHAAVACEGCHADQTFRGASTSCASCHAADDVHQGRFTARCESCHTATGWTRVRFDHGRDTGFRLTGKHASAACYSCHVQKNVASAKLPSDCFSCHAREDVHRGAFGRACGRCHGTSTFRSAIIRQ